MEAEAGESKVCSPDVGNTNACESAQRLDGVFHLPRWLLWARLFKQGKKKIKKKIKAGIKFNQIKPHDHYTEQKSALGRRTHRFACCTNDSPNRPRAG